MEYHLQVELWRGNVAGALQIARQRNELTDWIVAMAPLASHELWEVVCVEYADQLEEEGHYHKAASYLLAGHRVHQAIELFRNHKLYKEAVSLARIRLSPVDPILEDLYTEWGQCLMKEGQFEQAAKCYLAMRQIQEASKMIARRNDQSSLRTACHMSLLVKDQPSGMEYAFKLFSQYLISGEWKEAYGFVKEHDCLKPLVPLLSTHELLVEQMASMCPGMTLTQKPLDPATSFRQWGQNDDNDNLPTKNRVSLPDFLVNKLDTDPIIPWSPCLIDGHTFPHHVLRHWYYRLNMDVVPVHLKDTFGAISHLLELQKSFADIPQSMVVLSTHLTLCFIALLLSETSTAINHLLQATAFLHQNELREKLLCHFCQLVLPQGPKYLLKLQQEFNASRLVISLESPGGGLEQAGGEGHSTIKKYLSDIKDSDRGISSGGSRCRELDCLRSFYYLAVLEYLKEEFSRVGDHGEDDGIPPNKEDTTTSTKVKDATPKHDELTKDVKNVGNGIADVSNLSHLKSSPKKSSAETSSLVPCVEMNGSFSSPVDPSGHDFNPETTSSSSLSSNSSTIKKEAVPSGNNQTSTICEPIKIETESNSLLSLSSTTSPKSSSVSPVSSSSLSPSCRNGEKSKSNSSLHPGKLDQKNLLHISKGILWDVQAKREALTETLGYIHRAISQHLLTNRSDSASNPHKTTNQTNSPASLNLHETKSTPADEDGGCHSSRLQFSTTPSPSTSSSSLSPSSSSSIPPTAVLSPSPISSTLTSSSPSRQQHHSSSLYPSSVNSINTNTQTVPSHPLSQDLNNINLSRRAPLINRSISETVSSRKVCDNSNFPTDVFEVRQKVEQELLGIIPSSPTMTSSSHKGRKVFWRDSKENSPGFIDDALVKRNPEGTQIPLEWDDLPVDLKYTQPYISQALLRQEQETIAAELKQVPDGSKVPFPSTLRCTKTLLDACVCSVDLSLEEKHAYIKQLKDWSILFAVTSYGKDRVHKDFDSAFQRQQQQ